MNFVATVLALFGVVTFWGAGLACLIVPSRWRWCWPGLALAAGLALQSAVVWTGAMLDWRGTDSYAYASLLVPIGLFAGAIYRMGGRRLWQEFWQWRGVHVVMVLCLVLLTLPLAWRSDNLTTTSLASCDAADYAAGARVFKEFAASDRSGFLGLIEVVSVGSEDNFFDFWTTLNHFTPSALIALNGSLLGREPYEITNLVTLVFLISAIPVVYLLARSLFGIGRQSALWVALIYGLSPLTWYAAYHVASAQLIAATGIGWVTWWAVVMWRGRHQAKLARGVMLPLVVAFSILWGAYNFIIVVCLVPALAIVGGQTLWTGAWRHYFRWLIALVVPLALSGGFYFERAAGLVERFRLFAKADFGWRIPALQPEGWLGLVADRELAAWSGPQGVVLTVVVLGVLLTAWLRCVAQRRSAGWIMAAAVGPVLLGYFFLQWRGLVEGTKASYDAYKLFAVFYPVLLGAFCLWLRWLREHPLWRALGGGMMILVLWGNGHAIAAMAERMSIGPFKVGERLIALQQIEALPEVDSVNIRIPDLWDRLWANHFLLRKPQYFRAATYEGRRQTQPRGEWDLTGGLVQIRLPEGDSRQINDRFSLIKVDSLWMVRAEWGLGWHGIETWHSRNKVRWNWSGQDGKFRITNPQSESLWARFRFKARGAFQQTFGIRVNNDPARLFEVDDELSQVVTPPVKLPAGNSVVTISAKQKLRPVSAEDSRILGMAVYGVVIEVLPADSAALEKPHE